MARTVQLGKTVELTALRNYHWEIEVNGAGELVVTERYVVTDAAFDTVPEGQQSLPVTLASARRTAMTAAFTAARDAAAAREQVVVG